MNYRYVDEFGSDYPKDNYNFPKKKEKYSKLDDISTDDREDVYDDEEYDRS